MILKPVPIDRPTAKVTSQQVDKVFDRIYPRANKPRSGTDIDRHLRQEWCAVADRLIDRKSTK